MDKLTQAIGDLVPQLSETQFNEKGMLTAQEFVEAGDYLVSKFRTWEWESCEADRRKSYLPHDKQYLRTRNVPCHDRARRLEYAVDDELQVDGGADMGDEEGWTVTHTQLEQQEADADGSSEADGANDDNGSSSSSSSSSSSGSDDDSIPDIADVEGEDFLAADEATAGPNDIGAVEYGGHASDDNILRTRTYDVHLTYDNYYRTPRVWLFGYDEHGMPLAHAQILDDISQEHANKTVTIEQHPHLGLSMASIHPCKHAPVMKKLIDQLAERQEVVRVDQYMPLFLKFISAVIPTVEYDYTA